MSVRTVRVEPHAVNETYIGTQMQAMEGAEIARGGLSDVLQCWNVPARTTAEVIVALAVTGCALGKTEPHTHLFLGGRSVVLSHARGVVLATVPTDPCTGTPLPEGAPS